MDRILKKFCAKPVQILLDRIRERPEDFDRHRMTIWYRLATHKKDYTWVERKAVDYAMRRREKVYNRKVLLDRILEETVNPSSPSNMGTYDDTFYAKPGQLFQPNPLAEYQKIYTETMRRTLDSQALISPNIVRFDSNGNVLTTPCK